MEKILIVEDNKDVNQMLAETLQEAGYETKSVYTGLDGLKEAKTNNYQMILLDIMLPYKSGDEVLKEVRTFSDIPVIILSAKDMIGTKIDLLKLGADDYITKPFDLGEVVARIDSTLRRVRKSEQLDSRIKFKDIAVNCGNKTVTVNGVDMSLTAKEYQIMELLVKHQDKVFSKVNIYETIWGEEYLGDDNAVKTHMSNLRNKLKKIRPDEEYIETVWGLGYRLSRQQKRGNLS